MTNSEKNENNEMRSGGGPMLAIIAVMAFSFGFALGAMSDMSRLRGVTYADADEVLVEELGYCNNLSRKMVESSRVFERFFWENINESQCDSFVKRNNFVGDLFFSIYAFDDDMVIATYYDYDWLPYKKAYCRI